METAAKVDMVGGLSDSWKSTHRKDRASGFAPRSYIYASAIRTCTRAMSLDVTHPEDQPPFDDDALARMQKGKEREEAIVAWLMRSGRAVRPASRSSKARSVSRSRTGMARSS